MSLPGGGGGKIPATPGSDIKSMDWTTRNAYVAKFMTLLNSHQKEMAESILPKKNVEEQIDWLSNTFIHVDPFSTTGYKHWYTPEKTREDEDEGKGEEEDRRRKEEEERRRREEEDHLLITGGGLEKFRVEKLREIDPTIWVCGVHFVPPGYVGRLTEGSEVLVQVYDIFNVSRHDLTRAKEYHTQVQQRKSLPPNFQTIRIGSWNIRCTGEFQIKNNFFPELIQRFHRLAAFINHSKCDIVALQEFPIKFEHSASNVELAAQLLLPELIGKLESESNESWGFGYSEDFPQSCWTGDRTVKDKDGNDIDEYPSSNGQYIHAFVFKRAKIECHSVEQVLDVNNQENRFKHAPSLGRFTFKDNFHFSLCNVHLRPENTRNRTDSRYEIKDLGDCIDQLRRFNPDSTIFLGDFNMSACRWAPDSVTPQSRCTEFPPFVSDVWDSFRAKNYTHAVQNRFTNTSENKQFDNIWLPEKLQEKHRVETRAILPPGREGFRQTENVCRLQDFFQGAAGRELIAEMTDHHLVFVDLDIDVARETENIKKIIEVGNGMVDREYDGFNQPTPVPVPVPVPGGGGGPFPLPVPYPEPEPVPVPVPEPVVDDRVLGNLAHARSHFRLWNTMDNVPSVADMGGPPMRLHWSKNLFPPDFQTPSVLGEKDKQAFDEMKRLEASYLEKLEEFTALEERFEATKEQLRRTSSASEMDNIKRTKNEIAKDKGDLKKEMNDIFPQFERLIRSLSESIKKKFVKIRAILPQP